MDTLAATESWSGSKSSNRLELDMMHSYQRKYTIRDTRSEVL